VGTKSRDGPGAAISDWETVVTVSLSTAPGPSWHVLFMLPTPKLGTSSIALTVYAYAAVHASVIKKNHGIRQNAVNKRIRKGGKTNPNLNV